MRLAVWVAFLVGAVGPYLKADAAEAGFYVGVDAGMVEATAGKSDGFDTFTTGIPIPVLPQSTRVRGSDLGWNVAVGYRINRHFAGEFAYAEFGSVDIEETYDLSEFPVGPPVVMLDSNSQVTGPTASILGIVPFAADRFEAFVRGGVLFADQKLKGDLGVASGVELNNAEELWLVGVGVSLVTTHRWSARLEYQAVERLRSNSMTGTIRLVRFSLGVTYDF